MYAVTIKSFFSFYNVVDVLVCKSTSIHTYCIWVIPIKVSILQWLLYTALHRAHPGSSNPLRDSTYRRQINLEYTVDEVEGEKRKMKIVVKMTVLEERIYF